jgi:filamentous hemagglutinin family protein
MAGAAQAQNQGVPLHRSGRVTLGDAVIEPGATAGSALVRLRAPSRLEWEPLHVGAGETLRIQSETGSMASLHVVRGALPARLEGRVVADGPFYLVSPGGVHLAAGAHVQAPRVFMSALAAADESALLAGAPTGFAKTGSGLVELHGTVEAAAGQFTVLGANLSVGPTATLRAPGGQIQLTAVDTQAVTASGATGMAGVPPGPRSPDSRANLTTRGHLVARRIDLVSEGFLRNGGRLETAGPGNRVLLSALASTHESRPRDESIIITDDLVTDGEFRPEGPVISPRDGANPSPIGGVRQTPRLSQPGFVTQADGGTSQLAFSPLQTLTTTSPIPPPSRAATVAARSGPDPDDSRRRLEAHQSKRRTAVRKGSFFGQLFKR